MSVVVAVKNGEAYLRECLESIVASTYRPIEILVVDGASTDSSAEIARSFADVRIVQQKTGGIPGAYNLGVSSSRGSLIAFLSHDDRWTPDKLELQEQVLRDRPELGGVAGMASFFLDSSLSEPPHGFRPELIGSVRVAWIVETLLVRRSVFEEVGPFDTRFRVAEDVDWISRARDAGIRMSALEQVVVHKRVHQANASLSRENGRFLIAALKASLDRKRGGC